MPDAKCKTFVRFAIEQNGPRKGNKTRLHWHRMLLHGVFFFVEDHESLG